jgi:hypothetical protein
LDGHQERNLAEAIAEDRDRAIRHEGLGRHDGVEGRLDLFWLDQDLGHGRDEQPTDGVGELQEVALVPM